MTTTAQPCRMVQLDPSDRRWEAIIKSSPQACVFHHPAWITLLAECYRFQPFIYALTGADDTICAGLPLLQMSSFLTGKRWISLPFTDYCPPLYHDQYSLESLTLELVDLSRRDNNPYLEVRWALPAVTPIQSQTQYVQHTIELAQDFESVVRSFHRTQRQNVKTAEKNGVQISRGANLETMREFYRLHCLTRRRQGVPVQPWRFFELLLEKLFQKDLGFILLAEKAGQCLAAGLFLHWGATLTYKYAASSDTGQDLRPNHLITSTAIQWGCENGFRWFDFGRTELGNEGLRTFKTRWGAEEKPLVYSIVSNKPVQPSSPKLEALMHRIIKNSPVWVCRASGALLYRHFG